MPTVCFLFPQKGLSHHETPVCLDWQEKSLWALGVEGKQPWQRESVFPCESCSTSCPGQLRVCAPEWVLHASSRMVTWPLLAASRPSLRVSASDSPAMPGAAGSPHPWLVRVTSDSPCALVLCQDLCKPENSVAVGIRAVCWAQWSGLLASQTGSLTKVRTFSWLETSCP